MKEGTPIYGHSRGYRTLAMVSLLALLLSMTSLSEPRRASAVAVTGSVGFALLAVYAWSRSARRTAVMTIEDEGFCICDPAIALGLLPFEEIQEIRIYATLERPLVAFRLLDPRRLGKRTPLVMRIVLRPLWAVRRYQVVLELDRFNDQIMAIKTTALKAGIPVVSELV